MWLLFSVAKTSRRRGNDQSYEPLPSLEEAGLRESQESDRVSEHDLTDYSHQRQLKIGRRCLGWRLYVSVGGILLFLFWAISYVFSILNMDPINISYAFSSHRYSVSSQSVPLLTLTYLASLLTTTTLCHVIPGNRVSHVSLTSLSSGVNIPHTSGFHQRSL
jgi:hypothetical protein